MTTMKELREKCRALGITPKRSIAATEEHIAEMEAYFARQEAAARQAAEEWRAGKGAEVAKTRKAAQPRMSRTMRMLADCTAICGTLARNPLIYGGDEDRHDYATTTGYLVAVRVQARDQWRRQPWPTPRRFV